MEKRGKKKMRRGKYNEGEQYAPSEPCDSKGKRKQELPRRKDKRDKI